MSKLLLDLRPGEAVSFGDGSIRITMQHKSGQFARLLIEADPAIAINQPRRQRPATSASNAHERVPTTK